MQVKQKYILLYFIIILQLLYSSALAQNCAISGVIHDAENNEPLPFANIKIANQDKGTVSDINGKFIIDNLQAGYIVLQVSFIGYNSKSTNNILLSNNNIQYIDIDLEPKDNMLQDVEIRPASFVKKEEAPISMQSIGTKEIESNPGSNRDISRVIQSFPGVGSTQAYRNDIIIRGGGPAENRFYLDDVEIPVINHFATQGASGGPVGIINADFIRNVDFYSSAFPSEKYNALSGVLDFKQKDGNIKKTNIQMAVGASETSLTLDGPIEKKTSYIFSVRRSYLQFLFSAIGLPFLPTFNDYQVKVKTNFNTKNKLTIISIGSLDNLKINTGIKNPDPSQQAILNSIPVNNQWSYTFGAVYKHFFNKGYHTIVLSRNMLNNQLYKYPENDNSKPKIFDYNSTETENKFRYEYHLRYNGIKLAISTNMEYANYYNNTIQKTFMLGKLIDLNYETTLNIFKYGASGHITKRFFSSKLLVSLGTRLDANNYNYFTSKLLKQFSPRFSLSYDVNNHIKINASAGKYFQQSAYTTMGYRGERGSLINKNTVKFIGLYQYNIGAEHFWNDKIMLSVEGFYKDYFNYPIDISTGSSLANQGADYSIYGGGSIEFKGKGRAYGVEILNRWDYKTFNILASYTFFRSKFANIYNKYIPSAWDSKHLLSVTISKKLKYNWQIGAKWRYVGSLPYTPYDLDKSAEKSVWAINNAPYLDYSLLNSKRNKPFHQLDIRIDKNFFFNKWTLMLYFDVQNAYNFKSDNQDIVLRKKNSDGTFKTTNNGKNYILELYPNRQGTILPSIGIMVKI